jgi:hypothetical protein
VRVRAAGDHLALVSEHGDVEFYPASDTRFFAIGQFPDLTFTLDGFTLAGIHGKRLGQ